MILVTGASQGIGLACAQALLRRTGARVLITGRCERRLHAALDATPATLRARLDALVCDQAVRGDIDALCRRIAQAATPLEGAILGVGVNPAWQHGPQRIHSLDPDLVEATIRTNCTHTLLITRAVLGRLAARRGGTLLWIGSQGQAAGLPGAALYCATKSFLCGLARTATHEYGRRGVRTQLLHPGIVRTPRTAVLADRFAAAHGVSVAEADDTAERIADAFLDSAPLTPEVDL
jgi:NAD(P)-dependent dehydrogenase (short-subunit alcohol dehydrogenase family)